MSCRLLSKMWTFCQRTYAKRLMALSEGKNRKKFHETVPLNHMWTTSCLSRAVLLTLSSYRALQGSDIKRESEQKWVNFLCKMDLLLCWDKMSQQSWMKNMQTKCHRLWDKILQQDGLSHCDKPSKFTRLECHNLGWTDNPSALKWNVTVVNCHSRRFVGWMLSLGQNVAWLVHGWTDHQGTVHDTLAGTFFNIIHEGLGLVSKSAR